MTNLLLVGGGGFLGATLRYLIYMGVLNYSSIKPFYGTTSANLIGCLLGGIAFKFFDPSLNQTNPYYFFFVVGFLGSLTTLSALAGESVAALLNGQWGIFSFHVALNVFGGILVFFAPILIWPKP